MSTPGPGRVLAIIPAFNEEAALPAVLADLRARHPGLDVVVVDDGSTDRTTEVARAGGATVLTLPFNLGIGGALRAAFRYAVRHGYDRAVQLDGDGQHDPAELTALLDALDGGADLVIGSRFADRASTYRVSGVRKGAMRMMHLAVRMLSGRRFTDVSSGFRGFSGRTLRLFATGYPVDYLADTVEALLMALAAGLRVEEVPVTMRVRAGGTPSTRNLKLVYHYLRLLIVMGTTASRRSRRPEEATP